MSRPSMRRASAHTHTHRRFAFAPGVIDAQRRKSAWRSLLRRPWLQAAAELLLCFVCAFACASLWRLAA